MLRPNHWFTRSFPNPPDVALYRYVTRSGRFPTRPSPLNQAVDLLWMVNRQLSSDDESEDK